MQVTANVSFRVHLEAEDHEEIVNQINTLIDQLTTVETNLVWEDVDWDTVYEFASA